MPRRYKQGADGQPHPAFYGKDVYKRQAYISQMWAEAMEIYRSGMFKLSFSPAMQRYLCLLYTSRCV